ncbi:MAG: hypothetical protein IPJ08_24840 [Burkholderiales bacterium]|nr:hypothetical protein [Burkholderiales bacterium]
MRAPRHLLTAWLTGLALLWAAAGAWLAPATQQAWGGEWASICSAQGSAGGDDSTGGAPNHAHYDELCRLSCMHVLALGMPPAPLAMPLRRGDMPLSPLLASADHGLGQWPRAWPRAPPRTA